MIKIVHLSKQAESDLLRVPEYIRKKLKFWIGLVETEGLDQCRRIKGFHDEPLRGQRQGQRSIRLNRAHRAIYVIASDGTVNFVSVEEVNKHEY